MPPTYTEIPKPTLPTLKWDDPLNFWDEEDSKWDFLGYSDIDKPLNYTESENFLMINGTDFLLINATDKLIISIDQNSIYTEIPKPI